MRDGWTLTVEHLTYARTEPEAFDEDTDLCYVLRQYDTIVRARQCFSKIESDRDYYLRQLAGEGIIVDPEIDWRDYVLLADGLHAAWILAQPEELALAV